MSEKPEGMTRDEIKEYLKDNLQIVCEHQYDRGFSGAQQTVLKVIPKLEGEAITEDTFHIYEGEG